MGDSTISQGYRWDSQPAIDFTGFTVVVLAGRPEKIRI